jgi:hypothetical protein
VPARQHERREQLLGVAAGLDRPARALCLSASRRARGVTLDRLFPLERAETIGTGGGPPAGYLALLALIVEGDVDRETLEVLCGGGLGVQLCCTGDRRLDRYATLTIRDDLIATPSDLHKLADPQVQSLHRSYHRPMVSPEGERLPTSARGANGVGRDLALVSEVPHAGRLGPKPDFRS